MTPLFDKTKYPNTYSAFEYANSVVSRETLACIYIIGACERFLDDYKLSQEKNSQYIFDVDYVERYLRLVQKLEHVIADWKTKEIIYEPWQKWVWANALGFKHREDTKRPKYRTIHLEVPRGASKSTMASQCALYFIGLEPDRSGEKIAVFATKSDQARIILDGSRAMANKSSSYRRNTGVEVLAHKLVHPESFSEMVAMSSDSKSMDGLNLRVAFCDELHAISRELFEVIISGMKKRKDSLVICCTTAGFNTDGVGYSQSTYAKKVAIGEVIDDTFFSAVCTIDEGDDIFEETTWKKANPNYGVSVDPIAFEAMVTKAKVTPSDIANLKVKSLNMWLSEAHAYFNLDKWDQCADPTLKLEDFAGEKCVLGVDLASKIDLTSLGYVFKRGDIFYLFDKSFIPEQTVAEVKNVLYDNSIAQGHLFATPGEAIDYSMLEDVVKEDSKKFKITEIPYDPWSATSFAQNLEKFRMNMVEFRFVTANLSEPTKNLDAMIRQGKIRHNGSPLLRWAFGNIVCKEDAAGNVFPKKSHEKLKIDPAIALIMAVACWLQHDQKESVYAERGVRIL